MGSISNESFQRGAFGADGIAVWADGVSPDGSGHDERLGIMNDKRCKGASRTFNNRLGSLDEIEDMEVALGVMRNHASEPMPTGFDELRFVQAGAFFPPAVALGEWLGSIDY